MSQKENVLIRNFSELLKAAQKNGPKTVAVGGAHDRDVLMAVEMARKNGVANSVLVGDAAEIRRIAAECSINPDDYEIVDQPDGAQACAIAVDFVKKGKADIPMKGFVDTSVILKAVLNKENGLGAGGLISHVSVFHLESYGRMMLLSDSAMNIAPGVAEKADIIRNSVKVAHALGIAVPKVAAVCAVEKVNEKMQATLDARELTLMNERGEIEGCVVQGPLALDNAVSEEAAAHKGISGEVAGRADILLMPDIEAGNILIKAVDYFTGAEKAGIIMGAQKPVVLTSRASSDVSKLYSIVLGLVIADAQGK